MTCYKIQCLEFLKHEEGIKNTLKTVIVVELNSFFQKIQGL